MKDVVATIWIRQETEGFSAMCNIKDSPKLTAPTAPEVNELMFQWLSTNGHFNSGDKVRIFTTRFSPS